MTEYRCWKCGKEIKKLDEEFIRCPYCGCRVLFATRQPVAKKVAAT
jgi:DNA-directed RNA polymerase subunit RPC12/RpoP